MDDIHKAILAHNQKHFHQADNTPFAGGTQYSDIIGYTGMSQGAQDVVDGTFLEKYGNDLNDILPETEQVICELAMSEEIQVLGKKIECKISEDDYHWIQVLEREYIYFSIRTSFGKLQGHCQ